MAEAKVIKQISCGCRLYQVLAIRQLTVPERGVDRVTWPILEFYTPWNVYGMTNATDLKFCAPFGHEKY